MTKNVDILCYNKNVMYFCVVIKEQCMNLKAK